MKVSSNFFATATVAVVAVIASSSDVAEATYWWSKKWYGHCDTIPDNCSTSRQLQGDAADDNSFENQVTNQSNQDHRELTFTKSCTCPGDKVVRKKLKCVTCDHSHYYERKPYDSDDMCPDYDGSYDDRRQLEVSPNGQRELTGGFFDLDIWETYFPSATYTKTGLCYYCYCPPHNPHGEGDPHFSTWSDEQFDFQGECDMVLIDNPSFMNGVGMTVHGRTKLHGSWSSFASAAIKMGGDVIEVRGSDDLLINGVTFPAPVLDWGSEYQFPLKMADYSLTVQLTGPKSRRHIVHFGNGERLFITNYKEYMDIEVENPQSKEFAGSVGMFGSYNSGKMMARNGTTAIEDPNEFGQEWQVHPTDPQLFHTIEGPQYPAKCKMPKKMSSEQRHLRAMTKRISEDDAKKACAHSKPGRMQNCISDVFGADDLDIGGLYEDM